MQSTEWEKIFTNQIPDKNIVSGYIRSLQFNNEEEKQPN